MCVLKYHKQWKYYTKKSLLLKIEHHMCLVWVYLYTGCQRDENKPQNTDLYTTSKVTASIKSYSPSLMVKYWYILGCHFSFYLSVSNERSFGKLNELFKVIKYYFQLQRICKCYFDIIFCHSMEFDDIIWSLIDSVQFLHNFIDSG